MDLVELMPLRSTLVRLPGACGHTDGSSFCSAHFLCTLTISSCRSQVMDLVELTPLRSTLVGMPGASGLSVEQRKRLTIAVELVGQTLACTLSFVGREHVADFECWIL